MEQFIETLDKLKKKKKRFEYVNMLNMCHKWYIRLYWFIYDDIVRICNSHSSQAKSKCISIAHLKATELRQSAVQQNTVHKKHERKNASYKKNKH